MGPDLTVVGMTVLDSNSMGIAAGISRTVAGIFGLIFGISGIAVVRVVAASDSVVEELDGQFGKSSRNKSLSSIDGFPEGKDVKRKVVFQQM